MALGHMVAGLRGCNSAAWREGRQGEKIRDRQRSRGDGGGEGRKVVGVGSGMMSDGGDRRKDLTSSQVVKFLLYTDTRVINKQSKRGTCFLYKTDLAKHGMANTLTTLTQAFPSQQPNHFHPLGHIVQNQNVIYPDNVATYNVY